jgi:hypothetical protein
MATNEVAGETYVAARKKTRRSRGIVRGLLWVTAVAVCAEASAGPLSEAASHALGINPHLRPHALPVVLVPPHLPEAAPRRALGEPRTGALAQQAPDARAPSEIAPELPVPKGFAVHWQAGAGPVGPDVARLARNFHRNGLPIVHLWQSESGKNLVAVGLNPRGVPGIYFTQNVGN